MNKILVTGVTGTVGREVVNSLIAKNAQVVLGVRDKSKLNDIYKNKCEIVELDYDRNETFRGALRNISKVFLATPPWNFKEEKILENILSVGKAEGLQKVVRLSAICASDFNLFGNHSGADKMLYESDISSTSLLPNTFMQNFFNYQMISKNSDYTMKLPAGIGKTSFIDVRDIAEVATMILLDNQFSKSSLILTGPESLNFYEVADKFSAILNKKISYIEMNDTEWLDMTLRSGVPENIAKSFLGFNQLISKQAYAHVSPSVKNILGREAISLDKFIMNYSDKFNS